ncbi:MAG: hypothetical protein ABH986_05145 [archaeon]
MPFVKKEFQTPLELKTIDEKAIDEIAIKAGEEATKYSRKTISADNPFITTIKFKSGEQIQLVASGAVIVDDPIFDYGVQPIGEDEVWLASRIVTNTSEKFGQDLYKSNYRTGNDSFAISKPNGINEFYHLHSERFNHKSVPSVPRNTILSEIMGKLTEENVKEFLIYQQFK